MGKIIGKIISSASQIEYICQVYGKGEVANPPTPEDYRFGAWVKVPVGSLPDTYAVGVISDTQLHNPDYGVFGPRLSTPEQLEVFSPDYLNETAVLVRVLVLGQVSGGKKTAVGFCYVHPEIGALVSRMENEEIAAFHRGEDGFDIGYYSLMLSMRSPLAQALLMSVLDDLADVIPDAGPILNALRANLAWQSQIRMAAGER